MIKANSTALVLADMQNDFLHSDGAYGKAGQTSPALAALPKKLIPLVEAARAGNIFIVATFFTLVPGPNGEPMIAPHLKALRPFLKKGDFLPGSWGQQLLDELAPADATVEKIAFSAFYMSRLEWLLRKAGVERLYFAGIVTNGGVASTVRDAHVREFECTVIEDGCAAFSEDVHRAAIGGLRPVAKIVTIADAIAAFKGQSMNPLAVNARFVLAGAVVLAFCVPGLAESYPARAIKIFVGASPGGTTDTMARALAQPLSASLGQPVLVENRPGAGGNLAADTVAKSAADGYTLLVSFTSHTINATLYPKLPFDPVSDFTPISMIARVPSLLVGRPDLPAEDLTSLIALAKQHPAKLSIAIGGIGSSLHMAGEQFKMMAGINLLNVPYKGTAPALTDLLGGQVDLMFISLVTGAEQVRAGKLRAYGVTSPERLAGFPGVPAIGETVKDFESTAWFGVFAPAGLPAPVTEKLNSTIVSALGGIGEQLQREGATPASMSASAFADFVKNDVARWAPVVKQSGARPD